MPRQCSGPLSSQISPVPANYITDFLTASIGTREYLYLHTLRLALMSWQSSLVGLVIHDNFPLLFSYETHNYGSWWQRHVNSVSSPSMCDGVHAIFPGFAPGTDSQRRTLNEAYQQTISQVSSALGTHLVTNTKIAQPFAMAPKYGVAHGKSVWSD